MSLVFEEGRKVYMVTKNDGGPAFPGFQNVSGYGCSKPVVGQNGDVHFEEHDPGMSLRDWFAGMALQGFVAGLNNKESFILLKEAQQTEGLRKTPGEHVALMAYAYADSMLAERTKPL